MRRSLTAAVLVCVFLVPAISQSLSVYPEDLEGSEYDLDGSGSGSGSGDGSEQDEITNQTNNYEGRRVTANAGGRKKNTFLGSSGLTSDSTQWPAGDDESGFVFLTSSKPFWENRDILTGITAGAVTGVALAAALAAVYIRKWQKKGMEGHILGRRRASDEDYHKPIRDMFIV